MTQKKYVYMLASRQNIEDEVDRLASYPRVQRAWAGAICDSLLQMVSPQGVQSQGKRTKSWGQEFHGCFQHEMPYAFA